MSFLDDALRTGAAILLIAAAFALSNWLNDRVAVPGFSRRIAGGLGGFAFLFMVLTLDAAVAASLTLSTAAAVSLLRVTGNPAMRGSGMGGHRKGWSELAFVIAGAASIVVGWGLMGDRRLAFIPIAFVAWGDNAAGIVRSGLDSNRLAGVLPSVAMLVVCLSIGLIYEPYWIAAAGAVVATAVERFRPTRHFLWEDNWVIVAFALGVMIGLRQWS